MFCRLMWAVAVFGLFGCGTGFGTRELTVPAPSSTAGVGGDGGSGSAAGTGGEDAGGAGGTMANGGSGGVGGSAPTCATKCANACGQVDECDCGGCATIADYCGDNLIANTCGHECMSDGYAVQACSSNPQIGFPVVWAVHTDCKAPWRIHDTGMGSKQELRPNGVNGCATIQVNGWGPALCCP